MASLSNTLDHAAGRCRMTYIQSSNGQALPSEVRQSSTGSCTRILPARNMVERMADTKSIDHRWFGRSGAHRGNRTPERVPTIRLRFRIRRTDSKPLLPIEPVDPACRFTGDTGSRFATHTPTTGDTRSVTAAPRTSEPLQSLTEWSSGLRRCPPAYSGATDRLLRYPSAAARRDARLEAPPLLGHGRRMVRCHVALQASMRFFGAAPSHRRDCRAST